MDSPRKQKDDQETRRGNAEIDIRRLQEALDTLAKYNIKVNPRELQAKTGYSINTEVQARVYDKNGNLKETHIFKD